jgi:hypothetical protein
MIFLGSRSSLGDLSPTTFVNFNHAKTLIQQNRKIHHRKTAIFLCVFLCIILSHSSFFSLVHVFGLRVSLFCSSTARTAMMPTAETVAMADWTIRSLRSVRSCSRVSPTCLRTFACDAVTDFFTIICLLFPVD